jgi:hypothetical protein
LCLVNGGFTGIDIGLDPVFTFVLDFFIAICLFFSLSGPGLTVNSVFVSSPQHPAQQSLAVDGAISLPVLIDSSPLTAFGAALDAQEHLWVAVGSPDCKLTLYRSQTRGTTWEDVLTINLNRPARLIELLAPAVPAPLFIFYLTAENHGDLYLFRFDAIAQDTQTIPLAVGPDTVDAFSVTIDRDTNYYIYLLYVNEHRTGLNGYFTRSLDGGRSWEERQPFWNCFDPEISFGTGSLLHCVWRYAITGREIHYAANRYYGAAGRWSGLYILKSGSERCFNPVVAQVPINPYWRAPVWACWTVARRDTEMLDLEYALSTDGGHVWGAVTNLGAPFVDEWFPGLSTATGSAELCYNAGARTENGPTVLYWRNSRSYAPQLWSTPARVNAPRLNVQVEGARPRLVALYRDKPSFPALFFSLYEPTGARGIYFAPVLPVSESNQLQRLTVLSPAPQPLHDLFDVTGRRVNPATPQKRSGVYFQQSGATLKKIVKLR